MEASNGEEDLQAMLTFVIPQRKKRENCEPEMKEAVQVAVRKGYKVTWVKEINLNSVLRKNNVLFVFEEFSGKGFKDANKLKKKILGPRALLHHLEYDFLLEELLELLPHPVLNMTFINKTVLIDFRNAPLASTLKKMVLDMGGSCVEGNAEDYTHVVTLDPSSRNSKAARAFGKPVMKRTWITIAYAHSLVREVRATDETFMAEAWPSDVDKEN